MPLVLQRTSAGGLLPAVAEVAPGSMALSLASLRIVVGFVFIVGGAYAATHLGAIARDFDAWHIPQSGVAVPALAATAIVCGALLTLGALTRPVALLLATIAIGALVTAGRYSGGLYLVVPPALFAACILLAWSSGRLRGAAPPRPPGVQ